MPMSHACPCGIHILEGLSGSGLLGVHERAGSLVACVHQRVALLALETR
jgi:hypothetical protein